MTVYVIIILSIELNTDITIINVFSDVLFVLAISYISSRLSASSGGVNFCW